MSADLALITAELHKLAAECSVQMTNCQRTRQLIRYGLLSQARELIYKAVATPAQEERQLVLTIATEGQPDAKAHHSQA